MEDRGHPSGVHTEEAGSQGPEGSMGAVSICTCVKSSGCFILLLTLLSVPPGSLCVCSNEAWRFSGGFARPVALSEVLLRGFKWGFAAFTVALAIEYTLFPPKKGGH